MIESDININNAAEHHHHHGTPGTSNHDAHSGEIGSDGAAIDPAGAANEHHHRDEEIEPKERKETMKGRTAPTLTALALAAFIGLISGAEAKADDINISIRGGAAISNAIEKIDDDIIIDNAIERGKIDGTISINYIQRASSIGSIGEPAVADIATDITINNIAV